MADHLQRVSGGGGRCIKHPAILSSVTGPGATHSQQDMNVMNTFAVL